MLDAGYKPCRITGRIRQVDSQLLKFSVWTSIPFNVNGVSRCTT